MPPGPKPGRLPVPSGTNPKATAPSPKGRPTPEGGVRGGRWVHPKVFPVGPPEGGPGGSAPEGTHPIPAPVSLCGDRGKLPSPPGWTQARSLPGFRVSSRCFATSVSAEASRPLRTARRRAPSAGKGPPQVSDGELVPPGAKAGPGAHRARCRSGRGCRSGWVPAESPAPRGSSGPQAPWARRAGDGVWRRTAGGAGRNGRRSRPERGEPRGSLGRSLNPVGVLLSTGIGANPVSGGSERFGTAPVPPRGRSLAVLFEPKLSELRAGRSRFTMLPEVRLGLWPCGYLDPVVPKDLSEGFPPEPKPRRERHRIPQRRGASSGGHGWFSRSDRQFSRPCSTTRSQSVLFPAARRQGRRTMPRWDGSATRGE